MVAVSQRRLLFAVALFAVPVLFSQSDAVPQYTRKQLREMAAHARTTQDHERLAVYYRGQERFYRQKGAEQKQALEEYNKAPQSSHSKYPTPGHSARHLASYYTQQADKSAALASEQEKRAKQHHE